MKAQAKINEEIGSNAVFVIRYFVQPGREAEALKYLEDGFHQNIVKEEMSPLQFITRNTEGEDDMESSVYAEEGAVCVKYKIRIDEEDVGFLPNLAELHRLRVEVLLKGFVSHSLKNRTNVKVDYSKVTLVGEEIDSVVLNNVLNQEELIPSEVA